jgi:hypothetical protein
VGQEKRTKNVKVREHVAELLQLPQDHEVMNEYGEETIARYYVNTYDDGDGDVEYVAYDTMEVVDGK